MNAIDDLASAKTAMEAAQHRSEEPRTYEPGSSAPVFGTGAPHLPISSTRGGIQ